MCLYPKLRKNRKYTKTKKNGGKIPEVKDKRVLYVPVACGNCMECRKANSREWQVRLQEDIREYKNGQMVTLTFSDESLEELEKGINGLTGYELENEIATKGVRRFLERWRKKYGKSCRHWLITELGQTKTERIHLHGIVYTNENKKTIEKIWKYGNIHKGEYVNEKTVNYIVKYITKVDKLHREYKAKMLNSPGIGKGYTKRQDSNNNKYKEKETNETYKTRTGAKIGLPKYYRNNIYTEEEKEKMWLEKLDREERWVDKVKVSIKENEKEYEMLLKEARKKNKRLGYGNDEKNWERKRYEEQRRWLAKMTKIKKRGKKR